MIVRIDAKQRDREVNIILKQHTCNRDPYWFFSNTSGEQVCQMTYLPRQNFACPFNREEMESLFWFYFHMTILTEHCVPSWGRWYWQWSVSGHSETIQLLVGTNEDQGLFICIVHWKERFCSTCLYLNCFSEVLLSNITKHHILINTEHQCLRKWKLHHRHPKLMIQGVDQILMICGCISSEMWLPKVCSVVLHIALLSIWALYKAPENPPKITK